MDTAPMIQHYRYAVTRSPEDGEFVATVAKFPSLSWLESDQIEAIAGWSSWSRLSLTTSEPTVSPHPTRQPVALSAAD